MSEAVAQDTDTTSTETEVVEDKAPEAAPSDDTSSAGDESSKSTLLSADEGDASVELSWQPPEGMELNESQQSMLDEFTAFAKENGLSQEQYKALIDYDVARGQAAVSDISDAFTARIDGWGEQTRADGELGGANINENLAVAKKAMDALVTPELGEVLSYPDESNGYRGMGLGNHPEVIRLFYRIGKALGEDSLHLGGEAATEGDQLRKMYPSMFSDQ